MSFEPALATALAALVSGRAYPDFAPQDTVEPFITYQQVGGVPTNTLAGSSNGQNARVQVNVWAKTREQANTLMRSVEAIVTAAPFRAVSLGNLVAEYNSPTHGRGARQDFSFWYRP